MCPHAAHPPQARRRWCLVHGSSRTRGGLPRPSKSSEPLPKPESGPLRAVHLSRHKFAVLSKPRNAESPEYIRDNIFPCPSSVPLHNESRAMYLQGCLTYNKTPPPRTLP